MVLGFMAFSVSISNNLFSLEQGDRQTNNQARRRYFPVVRSFFSISNLFLSTCHLQWVSKRYKMIPNAFVSIPKHRTVRAMLIVREAMSFQMVSLVVIVDFDPLGVFFDVGNIILLDHIPLASGDAQNEVVEG